MILSATVSFLSFIKRNVCRLSARAVSAEDFDATVKAAVEILTSSEGAVIHSRVRARILRDLITCGAGSGADCRAVVESAVRDCGSEAVQNEWEAVQAKIPARDGDSVWGEAALSSEYLDAVESFGKACPDPGNFQSALLGLATCGSFKEGVRRNLLAGGCNCSRANFLGACLGAAYGLGAEHGIPLEWVEKTDKGAEVLELMLALLE